jgi:hypothetical protein
VAHSRHVLVVHDCDPDSVTETKVVLDKETKVLYLFPYGSSALLRLFIMVNIACKVLSSAIPLSFMPCMDKGG